MKELGIAFNDPTVSTSHWVTDVVRETLIFLHSQNRTLFIETASPIPVLEHPPCRCPGAPSLEVFKAGFVVALAN